MLCATCCAALTCLTTLKPASRGKASVVKAASILASVPQQTVAAVETTWVGASELLKEAVDEGHEQVSCSLARSLTNGHRLCFINSSASMCTRADELWDSRR